MSENKLENMKNCIKAAKGEIKADLLIKNCKYANVFNKEFVEGDVAIYKDKIVGIGAGYEAERVIDAKGGYVCPGLIDAHLHIESSMVKPSEYARVIMPKGVTSIIADPHEIANVCGEEGVEFMIESGKNSPLDINFMIPSCVPATTFENSGAVLDSERVKSLIEKTGSIGLGEMMNYPGVLGCDDDTLKKICYAEFTDGHAPLLSGKDLNAYICAGVSTDHECSNGEELEEKVSKGMYVQLREGTCSKNVKALLPFINENNYDRCMFCSDDRYLGDIVKEGTVNYCIKTAIEGGLKPIYAVMMGSTNAARCYGLKGLGAVAVGYFADLIIVDDLESFNIKTVIKKGKIVCEDNNALFEISDNADSKKVINTVNRIDINADSFKDSYKVGDEVDAIEIIPKILLTKRTKAKIGEGTSKVCVIERHKKKNNIGIGYALNYNVKNGAVASTIGHDSHNIIVIGDNDSDMAKAVEALGESGGISLVKNGEVLDYLELNIGGLMSDKSYMEVLENHERLHKAVEELGINKEIDPFMTLAFLPLPVIPEIRITDSGLFDVVNFKFI